MARVFSKRRLQKKYVAFAIVIPSLVISSLFQVKCPVCMGTGNLTSTPGMEYVELKNATFEELYISRDTCSQYIVYAYTVALALKNDGAVDTSGYVKLILRDIGEAKVLDTQYVDVQIKASTEIDVSYSVSFRVGLDAPSKAEVQAQIQTGAFPDKTCGGSGRVPLNSWLLTMGLKDNFKETARKELNYKPGPYIPPDIEEQEILWPWENYPPTSTDSQSSDSYHPLAD